MSDFQSAFNKKLRHRTFRRTPHFLIPGLNQQRALCSEHCDEDGTPFPVHCVEHKLFIPKTQVPQLAEEGRDAATCLIGEKLRWQEKANVLAKRYRRSDKDRVTLELLHGKVLAGLSEITVPRPLAHFLRHMASDPDPDFCGAYNWYYTEGTVSAVNLKKRAFVISAQGKYLDKICVVPLEQNGDEWEACHSSVVRKGSHIRRKPIYQIKAKEVKDRAVVGVRQRNAVAVYLNNIQRLDLKLVQIHASEICGNEKPFTGLDLDFCKPGHFCNCHGDRTIKIWDPACRVPILESKAARNINCKKSNVSSWCGVWYDKDDINQLIVADSCCVTWHDVRCGLARTKGICLTSSTQGLPLEMSCEEISLVVPSQRHYQLYLGTTHSLLQVDRRRPTLEPQPLRRWTHMLDGQLLMGQAVPLSGTNSELICVSCTRQAVLVFGGDICCSPHQPLALPYMSINQGMVGLSFLPDPHVRRCDLITQVGNGDIYKHCLKWGNGTVETPFKLDMKYCSNSPDAYRPVEESRQLHVTKRCDMQPVYLGLQNGSGRSIQQREYTLSTQKQSWQRSKAELLSYVDVLAPGILDVWGVDEMQEWSTTTAVPSAVDKVQQWLQMNSSLTPTTEESGVAAAHHRNISEVTSTEQHLLEDNSVSQIDEADAEKNVFALQDPTTKSGRSQILSEPFLRGQFQVTDTEPAYTSVDNDNFHISFQSSDAVIPNKHTKPVNLKRKSQVLGF